MYLMIRRAPGVVRGNTWCFPGGHLEPGENARLAVCRELQEELGIIVEPLERLKPLRILRGWDTRYILAVWRVRQVGGEFALKQDEIAEARWVRPDEIKDMLPGLESNLEVLRLLAH